MKFTLEITCDNAAFTDPSNEDHNEARNMEVAYILRGISAKVDEGFLAGQIYDSNGNNVGVFKFFED
jgi:hypothetical protein